MQFPCFPPGVPPSPQYLTTSKENLERWEVGMKEGGGEGEEAASYLQTKGAFFLLL